jgi:glycosyltransferase involved in cell wall biosynthesis
MKIISPMTTGNGAYVLHQFLASSIPNYSIQAYSPYLTLFPPLLLTKGKCSRSDIIHTTADYGSVFKNKHTHLVITFHNYVLDAYMRDFSSRLQSVYYKTCLRYFTKVSLKHACAVTAVSHFTAELVKKDLQYPGEVEVIHNGVNTEIFTPLAWPKNSNKTIQVLFSGNLTRRKGADLLPLIADKLSSNIEILYTTGLRASHALPDHPRLRNIGSIPYEDMPKVYQAADILLFPTLREGFGLAAAEAMASGLPVVATDCSALPEIVIKNKGGYLCTPRAVDEFADAINTLADSPSLRKEMGQFNRDKIEQYFSLETMVGQYMNLFNRINV